jgi:hypothetical protein
VYLACVKTKPYKDTGTWFRINYVLVTENFEIRFVMKNMRPESNLQFQIENESLVEYYKKLIQYRKRIA